MRIWQRSNGSAVTGATRLKFGPDRWMFEEWWANLVTVLTRSTDTPLDQGFKYSFQLSPSTAESALDSSDFAQYMYFVEGYDFAPAQWGTINAKPCTLSFWFKTNMGGEHYVSFNSFSAMDKKPYHHIYKDGKLFAFRNLEGGPKRDPNFKWDWKGF